MVALKPLKKKKLKPTNHHSDMTAKKTQIVIGLAGRKLAGKTSVANHLLGLAKESGLKPIRLSFAAPLKAEVAKIFGPVDRPENKEVIRPVFQAVGQAAKTLFGHDYWTKQLVSAWNDYKAAGYNFLVVDDLRFPHESEAIRSLGGHVWRIRRDETDNSGDSHPSETMVDQIIPDLSFDQRKLEDLLDEVSVTYYKYV